jgi:hypothetical protein
LDTPNTPLHTEALAQVLSPTSLTDSLVRAVPVGGEVVADGMAEAYGLEGAELTNISSDYRRVTYAMDVLYWKYWTRPPAMWCGRARNSIYGGPGGV